MSSKLKSELIDKLVKLKTGASLYVERCGHGDELIVFLHAIGGNSSSWSKQIDFFSEHYECLAMDMRGHSRSVLESCDGGGRSISINDFAHDTIALIEASGFGRAHLVGLSMGAVVALEVFKQRKDLVQSLCLANTWAHVDDGEARIEFIEDQLSKSALMEVSQKLIPGLFGPGTEQSIVDSAIVIEGSKDKEVFLTSWRSMFRVDFRDSLKEIDKPVLLIGGSHDQVTPTEPLLKEIENVVPLAQLVNIEGAGHFSNLDHADSFNKYLSIHLRRSRSKGSQKLTISASKREKLDGEIVAHGLLKLLDKRGITYFFSNSGTDFTPIIDAFARFKDDPDFNLTPIVAPHENTAIAMAHGYYLVTGKPQVVMGHVNVGTANMGLGIINASRSHIPIVVLSGNTPWYDSDIEGCRTNFVQWGQDTFDQSAYFREFTKWDYQLKGPHHLSTVVDRALAIATSDPCGPVYLTLPKEALCMDLTPQTISASPGQNASCLGAPAPDAVAQAARLIASSKNPVIVTAELGRYPGGVEALIGFVRKHAVQVIEHGKKNFFNFPTEMSFHQGFDPYPTLEDADLVIAIESHVPWIPALGTVAEDLKMIQIGVDPLCAELPMRAFPVDVSLVSSPDLALNSLSLALECLSASQAYGNSPFFKDRNVRIEQYKKRHNELFDQKRKQACQLGLESAIAKDYLSYAIGQAVDDQVVIFNEYNLDPYQVPRRLPDTWFENSIASGLGWSLGAALGAQLASPDQTMLVTLGDGSYMFNTPLSAHYVAAAYGLPIVIVVFNDNAWSTIKKSYKGSMPSGWALKNDYMPLCDFQAEVRFESLAEAVGGVGIRVESADVLIDELKRAIQISRTDRKHVLVNVVCNRDG